MLLREPDLSLFFKLQFPLLIYTNQQLKIIEGVSTIESFLSLKIEEKIQIRDNLYEHIDLISLFYEENPFDLTEKELGIILSWKNFIKGSFLLYKYLKKYTLFLDERPPAKVYGVLALSNPFYEIVPFEPIIVQAVLLPFKDQIVYDGFIRPYSVYLGPHIRSDFKELYNKAKARYGIIERLPFRPPPEEESNINLLKFYLKNDRNFTRYEIDIQELIGENPDLLFVYHQELGKLQARKYQKDLFKLGIRNGWFALLEGIVVASGETREEVERMVKKLVPESRLNFVYYFEPKK